MKLHAIFTPKLAAALCLLVFLADISWLSANEKITDIKIDNPREFGYFIGDTTSRTISFKLQKPWQVDASSLPEAGRFGLWLELLNPTIESFDAGLATDYRLQFIWQIIGIDGGKTRIDLPQFDIRLTYDGTSTQLVVPVWSITVLPILVDGENTPMPVQTPAATSAKSFKSLQWIAGIVLVLSTLGLALIRWLIPVFGKRRYPFALACRELASRSRDADYASSLAIAHRAFDQTASRALFHSNFSVLFEQAPWLQGRAEPIARFYQESEAFFFSGEHTEASVADLIDLCRSCRALERSR